MRSTMIFGAMVLAAKLPGANVPGSRGPVRRFAVNGRNIELLLLDARRG
jgi:hypothetical protein